MNNLFVTPLFIKRRSYFLYLLLALSFYCQKATAQLDISVIAAPNLIVDSNVESPSNYAPKAVHFGVEVCNNGATDMTDVFVNIGDYAGAPATPGIYPVTVVPPATYTYEGTFSFTHVGAASDATRYIKILPAGECTVQYWLVEYPTVDDSGNTIVGGASTDDDLSLNYDVWATANGAGGPFSTYETNTATMRNEIGAMANKISPNGISKIPEEYLDAIEDVLGWRPEIGGDVGAAITVEGIWFDLGIVNKGFDSDGDYVPDYNIFLQPVGDPDTYDPGCFRLVKTYGLVIVKKTDGTETLIPFEDQTYFKDLPQNNNGAVGLVYYEFVALNGPCTSSLTPYQSVAGGKDNEKFNGDYGVFIPSLYSSLPNATLDDTGVTTSPLNAAVEFNVVLTNSTGGDLGSMEYGLPVVMETDIPTGTEYVSGSAAGSNTLPSGISATILYSTDGGITWSKTEPATASDVTNIQWWMSDVIADTEVVDVTFQTLIPAGYTESTVTNNGSVALGGGAPFLTDPHTVLVEGNNTLSGRAFEDNGGTTGIEGNGNEDGDEGEIQFVNVSLYLDTDADGTGDIFISTLAANATGDYTFNNLPDGNYVVIADTDLSASTCAGSACTGWILGTENDLVVDLDAAKASGTGVTVSDADFGFLPVLSISKTSNDGASVYEDNLISYNISLTNNSYNTNPDVITAWGATDNGTSDFDNFANALSADGPDGLYASKSYAASGSFSVDATGFDFDTYTCPITSVQAVFQIYLSANLSNDFARAEITVGGSTYPYSFTTTELNAFVGGGNVGELKLDISALKTWAWADFQTGFSVNFLTDKVNQGDASTIYLDAIGIKVNDGNTTDCISARAYEDNTLINSIPLVDTYDATKLEYVSASIEPDVVATGSLTWNNAMPLAPGETGLITVYFNPLVPTGATTNTATVTGATFLDGSSANDGADAANVAILNTGSVSGTIWNDASGATTGWTGANGYDGSDSLLLGVMMNLYACVDDATGDLFTSSTIGNTNKTCSFNGGTWTVIESTETDAAGNYSFDGLFDGYYYAEVDNTTIPGTITQTGDVDDGAGVCGTCDARWKDPTDNVSQTGIISSGNDISNVSFGYNANPAIEGTVWEDNNNNGIQNTGEIGISSVTVELQDGVCIPGSTCPTTTTDAEGNYSFVDQTAGTYTVTVVTASLTGTWTETAESDGGVNNSISEILTGGEISTGNSFGFHQTGSSTIGDEIYMDWDGDGVQDSGENGIAGLTVNLYKDTNGDGAIDSATDGLVATMMTTATGYSFTGLPAGDYIVTIEETGLPSFIKQTGDPDESGVTCSTCNALGSVLTVDGTSTYNNIDFGYQTTGGTTVSGTVWLDSNGDSIRLAESVIDSVTVELWADTDGDGNYELAKTIICDVDGNYTFDNLPNGNYQVKVSTNDTDIPKDAFGNPSVSTNGSSYDMVISSGDVSSVNSLPCTNCSEDFDFGFAKPGAIGSTVFSDANGNGAQDWTERGISGVTIELQDGICTPGSTCPTTTTDASGKYLFTGLPPGDYTIVVDAALLGAQTADPDRDGETCASTTYPGLPACDDQMADITLSYGTSFMGANFGYQAAGVIGEYIWLDANGDGIQDDGEPGIGDVEVILTNVTAVTIDGTPYAPGTYIDTVYTDLDGHFTYSDFPDGTYDITVTPPTDRTATYDADGGTDNTTQVVISSGAVSNVGNTWCATSDCSLDADFGYKLNGAYSLSGSICIDDGSEDGICSTGGETMLDGTVVYLYNIGGEFLGETTADVSGNYIFENLPADDYIVSIGTRETPLNISTTTTTGVTTNTSSVYQSITLAANTTGLDFGFKYNVLLDFGDLPTTYDVTKLEEGGAYHIITASPTLYLGAAVDNESTPVQNATATGDAVDDGIAISTHDSWVIGTDGGNIDATVVGTGWLVGWIDFNQDGDISDASEMIVSQAVSTSTITINFDIPVGALLSGSTFTRFRLFESEPAFAQFSYSGEATNGEVEDYQIEFAVLPVGLSHFSGEANACNTMLTWTAATEENFSHYELERSEDGRHFQPIEYIEGVGGLEISQTYHYYDENASSHNYYRLKMVDWDGAVAYSNIIIVKTDCGLENGLIVYPNPLAVSTGVLNVKLYSERKEAELLVFNTLRQVVKRINLSVEPAWNLIRFDVSDLPAGTYFVRDMISRQVTSFVVQE